MRANWQILDNRQRTVADYQRTRLPQAETFRLVSAYFSIYGYELLAQELESVGEVRFLYGDPGSVGEVDPGEKEPKSYDLTEQGLVPNHTLRQKPLARQCADWVGQRPRSHTLNQPVELPARQAVPNRFAGAGGRYGRKLQLHQERLRCWEQLEPGNKLGNQRPRHPGGTDALVRRALERHGTHGRRQTEGTGRARSALGRTTLRNSSISRRSTNYSRAISKADATVTSSCKISISMTPLSGTHSTNSRRMEPRASSRAYSGTTAAFWPTASDWARLIRRWRSSSIMSYGTSASWCCVPRNCTRTGRSTRRTPGKPTTRLPRTASATRSLRTPTCHETRAWPAT